MGQAARYDGSSQRFGDASQHECRRTYPGGGGISSARRARLSSRGEIYPRGLAADQAMRLALGALIGPDHLTVDEVISRIRGRFPESAALPGHPELDDLLKEVGTDLKWDESLKLYRRAT